MTDTTTEPDELVKPDGSPNWARARQLLAEHRDEAETLRASLNDEREQRRRVEAQRAADTERIGDLTAELTFVKAGVDVDGTAGRRFAESYDGPLDRDAVQRAYAGYLSDALAAGRVFAEHITRNHSNGASDA